MAKVFPLPIPPILGRKKRERTSDPRYVDGQRCLVEAMKYLPQSDPVGNRPAIKLLSETVRTRCRVRRSPQKESGDPYSFLRSILVFHWLLRKKKGAKFRPFCR